jgi:REP element-mobilizing transposase RayT
LSEKIIRNRKLQRLKSFDYSTDGAYFITICIANRENLFGEIVNGKMIPNACGKVAQKCWQEIPNHFPDTRLDEFIVMPNHIHGIVWIENDGGVGGGVGNAGGDVGNKNFCSLRGSVMQDFCLPHGAKDDNTRVGNMGGDNACVGNCHENSLRGAIQNGCQSNKIPWQTKLSYSLSSIIRGFKIGVTKWCRQNNQENFRWQKSFYDRIIRDEEELNRIREYIWANPVNWETDENYFSITPSRGKSSQR